MSPTAGYVPYFWLRPLLLVTSPTSGYVPYFWLRPLLLVTSPTAGYVPYCWLRPLLLVTSPTAGYVPYYWLHPLLLVTYPTYLRKAASYLCGRARTLPLLWPTPGTRSTCRPAPACQTCPRSTCSVGRTPETETHVNTRLTQISRKHEANTDIT